MFTIPTAAATIANTASVAVEYAGISKEAAIEYAIAQTIDSARKAIKRHGVYAGPMTRETAEDWGFLLSVAADARDNTSRPSTGPVRDYIAGLI